MESKYGKKATDIYLRMVETYLKNQLFNTCWKDIIKEQVVAIIKRNENVALEMNIVNNKRDTALKKQNNDCMKRLQKENDYNKLEKVQNPDYTEKKTEINEMKQNIMKKLTKVTKTDMKDRASLKNEKL